MPTVKESPRRTKGAKQVTQRIPVMIEGGRTVAWVTRDVYRLYEAETQKLLTSEEVTIAHWYYIRVLAEHGTMNQLDLSRRVGIAAATAVPAIDNLEKRGLVKRTRDPKDRRKNDVSITALGQQMIDKMLPLIVRLMENSLAGVDKDDLAAFWRVIKLAEDNLLKMAGRDAG